MQGPVPEANPGRVLDALFPGHDFMGRCWPDEALVVHGDKARWRGLDPGGILCGAREGLAVLARRNASACVIPLDRRDDHACVTTTADAALAAFDDGCTVFVPRVEAMLPAVGEWLCRLWGELGLPRNILGRAFAYAARSGGVAAHFDTNANFVVQLAGCKRWQIARNRAVDHPTVRYATSMDSVPAALLDYAGGLPCGPPPADFVADLSPGSACFVPRGWWHATETLEPSLSLHFIFPQPTWADLACAALHRQLTRRAVWRGLADGVFADDPAHAARGLAQLAGLQADLRAVVDALAATELVALSRPAARRFERLPGTAIGHSGAILEATRSDGSTVRQHIDEALLPVAARIAGSSGPFFDGELDALRCVPPAEVDRLLESLVDAGVLARLPNP